MVPRQSGSKDGEGTPQNDRGYAEEDSTVGRASLSKTAAWADVPPSGGPCAFLAGAAGGICPGGSSSSGGVLGGGAWPGSVPGAGAWPGAPPGGGGGGTWPGSAPGGGGGAWLGAPPGGGGAWPGVPLRGGVRWKNVAQEIKGCSRFRYNALQNEDDLEDLGNTGDDHWSASSGSLSSQGSRSCDSSSINVDEGEADNDDSELEEVTPTSGRRKRGGGPVNNKGKKPRTTAGHWFREQMGKIVEMSERTAVACESIARRRRDEKPGCSIQDVMALVKECGATPGTDEHFIATILFTKRAQREMFMTLGSHEDRFDWLRRMHEWMTRNDVSK